LAPLEEIYKRSSDENKGWRIDTSGLIPYSELPMGMAEVPFIWDNNGTEIDMEICCGFPGICVEDDGYIKP